jgi:hypothetical protein
MKHYEDSQSKDDEICGVCSMRKKGFDQNT